MITRLNPADPDRTASGNYLENGGFEGDTNELVHHPTDKAYIIGSLANGWQDDSWVTSDLTVHYALDSSVRHGGSTSQRVEVQKQVKGHVTFVQNRHLLAGRYTAGIWLRSTGRGPIKVSLRGKGINENTFPSKKILSSDQWQHIELS